MEEITAATLEQPAGATSLQERLPDEVKDSPALFRWRMTIQVEDDYLIHADCGQVHGQALKDLILLFHINEIAPRAEK
ncbi:MAG: hypothetical protein ACO2ER_03950 [Castellaniella sp.]